MITVRDTVTGEMLGFFSNYESVLVAAARCQWRNYAVENRAPTTADMDTFYRYGAMYTVPLNAQGLDEVKGAYREQ